MSGLDQAQLHTRQKIRKIMMRFRWPFSLTAAATPLLLPRVGFAPPTSPPTRGWPSCCCSFCTTELWGVSWHLSDGVGASTCMECGGCLTIERSHHLPSCAVPFACAQQILGNALPAVPEGLIGTTPAAVRRTVLSTRKCISKSPAPFLFTPLPLRSLPVSQQS
jgi:hypothetical protein